MMAAPDIIYNVLLYKEDCAILHICWAVELQFFPAKGK